MERINVKSNRNAQKWTGREQLGRFCWGIATPLFRLSPRPFWGWRRFLLRVFGARVGWDVRVHPTVRIIMPWNINFGAQCAVGDRAILYALGQITIGDRATISQGAHLCAGTHDWRDPAFTLVKSPIDVAADAWICADAFVGPNVKVGEGAIIGARAVVTKSVASGAILAGNPAREIGKRTS